MDIKPIKKLGQNFLRDEGVLRRIADAAQLNGDDVVLEIGTGTGNLTKYLCQKASFVYTIEKDARLCKIAEENLKEVKNVKIICGDILLVLGAGFWVLGENPEPRTQNPLKIIGNLPYYITTPIIFKLLKQRKYISDIFITVQKEVAQRIVAKPGGRDYGVLSCSVQFYTKPQILFYINKSKFYPQPEVDSALIRMKVLDKPAVAVQDEEEFLGVIKAAFSQRRKTLLNSLASGLKLEKRDIENTLNKTGIEPKRRAETLSLEEFAKISNFLL